MPKLVKRKRVLRGVNMSNNDRRTFLKTAAAFAALPAGLLAQETRQKKAQIAITLDLEMSAQYPRDGMTEWNYQKGNLDQATKEYAVGAAEVVKSYGGRLHFFCVGRVLEQADIDWLKENNDDQLRRCTPRTPLF